MDNDKQQLFSISSSSIYKQEHPIEADRNNGKWHRSVFLHQSGMRHTTTAIYFSTTIHLLLLPNYITGFLRILALSFLGDFKIEIENKIKTRCKNVNVENAGV